MVRKKILQKDVEREFLLRKEEADKNWENLMHRINSGERVSQFEIGHLMMNCNTADEALLQENHRNKKIEKEEAEILMRINEIMDSDFMEKILEELKGMMWINGMDKRKR